MIWPFSFKTPKLCRKYNFCFKKLIFLSFFTAEITSKRWIYGFSNLPHILCLLIAGKLAVCRVSLHALKKTSGLHLGGRRGKRLRRIPVAKLTGATDSTDATNTGCRCRRSSRCCVIWIRCGRQCLKMMIFFSFCSYSSDTIGTIHFLTLNLFFIEIRCKKNLPVAIYYSKMN